MFTDSHCHLFNEYYEDIEKILYDAKECGISKVICSATNNKNALELIETSRQFDSIYIALGIHPEDVHDDFDIMSKLIRENRNNNKLVAIGEIGLDYHYGKEDRDLQIELFERQLALASELNLPVIVHSRDATKDTMDSLKKFKVTGVMHCFNGSVETAREYLKMGFYFGVGGVMTFKNAKLDGIIKQIPINRVVLETDAPYLTPEPFRKYKNEPKYIKRIGEYLADLYGVSLEDISSITEANIKDVFDI